MLTVCINSFNDHRYALNACKLADTIISTLQGVFTVLIAFGGCKFQRVFANEHLVVVSVTCNLSDHNIYPALQIAHQVGVTRDGIFLMLHDTCEIRADVFQRRMNVIRTLKLRNEWIFAHLYGLYNIGICDLGFALKRAAVWEGIRYLPKADGISLENGKDIILMGRCVESLRNVSSYTLASDGHDVSELDTISITHATLHKQKRFVSYMSSIGVYKTFVANSSFTVPIYASTRPECVSDREALREMVGKRLLTSMSPLILCSTRCS